LVERFVYTEDVGGSSPSSPTIPAIPVTLCIQATSVAKVARGWLSIGSGIANTPQIGMDVFGVQQLGCFRVTLGQQRGNNLARRVVDATFRQSMSPLVDMACSDVVDHS
jgi:hypothetical protein